MANEAPPQIQYQNLMAECQQLMTKVADLESDRNEHILVEDTLKPLDGGRRAYRLVGDVLVERTVSEVLPSITQNKNNVRKTNFFSGKPLVNLSSFRCRREQFRVADWKTYSL